MFSYLESGWLTIQYSVRQAVQKSIAIKNVQNYSKNSIPGLVLFICISAYDTGKKSSRNAGIIHTWAAWEIIKLGETGPVYKPLYTNAETYPAEESEMSGVHSTTGELSTTFIFHKTFPYSPSDLLQTFPGRSSDRQGVGIHQRGKRKQKMRKGSRIWLQRIVESSFWANKKGFSRFDTGLRGWRGWRGCITNEVPDRGRE